MANYDEKTGIHFGAISQNSVLQAWADSAEAVYPPPVCPVCSGSVKNLEEGQDPELVDAEYYCANCDQFHTAEDCLPEEPGGYQYIGEGYEAISILDTDILLVKSPYYTLARPCSPCVPNAGNLNSTESGYIKTYCFGPDWFEDNKAPYPIYDVPVPVDSSPN